MASQKPAELTREQRVKLLKKRVLRATFGSALLPGLGQLTLAKLVPSQRAFGLAMIVLFAGGVAGAVMHLLSGLWLFESALGSFAFGVLLRSLVLIYLFGIVDAYFCALRPDDQDAVLRRRAVGLNMLLPGAGYLLTRTWLRALMGLGVSAMVVFFAVARYHRFLDLVFVGLQLIMGAAMHQQRRIAEADERGTVEPPRPVLDPVAPAQIFVLMAVLVGLGAVGWVIARRMPSYDFAEVRSKVRADLLADRERAAQRRFVTRLERRFGVRYDAAAKAHLGFDLPATKTRLASAPAAVGAAVAR